jgi:hypothetical protein
MKQTETADSVMDEFTDSPNPLVITDATVGTNGTFVLKATLPTTAQADLSVADANASGSIPVQFSVTTGASTAVSADGAFDIALSDLALDLKWSITAINGTPVSGNEPYLATADDVITITGTARQGIIPVGNANFGAITFTNSFIGIPETVTTASHGLTIAAGSVNALNQLTADAAGNLQASFRLSTSVKKVPGRVTTIRIASTDHTVDVRGKVVVRNLLGAEINQVTREQQVNIVGNGYQPTDTVSIRYGIQGSEAVIETIQVSSDGTFTVPYTIPETAPAGDKRVIATDNYSFNSTLAPNIIEVITVVPRIIEPEGVTIAKVGDSVNVKADTLPANQAVVVTVGGVPATITSGSVADAEGNLDVTFTVPGVSGGPQDVVIASGTLTATYDGLTVVTADTVAVVTEDSNGAALAIGQVLTVTLTPVADASEITEASFSVGNVGPISLPAVTQTDGSVLFVASYAVAAGDAANGAAIEAEVTLTNGDTFKVVSASTVTLDGAAEARNIAVAPMVAKMGDTVVVTAHIEEGATATVTIEGEEGVYADAVVLTADAAPVTTPAAGFIAVTASITVEDGDMVTDGVVTVTTLDAASNSASFVGADLLSVDAMLEIESATAAPATAHKGSTHTITVETEAGATVTADVSAVDSTVEDPIELVASDDAETTYTATFTVSQDTEAGAGDKNVVLTVTDAAGNVKIQNLVVKFQDETSVTITLHAGVNLVHVPVKTTIAKASDLFEALGGTDSVSVVALIGSDGRFKSFTATTPVESAVNLSMNDATGAIVVMKSANTVTFTGQVLSNTVALNKGLNVVGVPRSGAVASVSELAGLSTVISVVVHETGGTFVSYTKATGAVDTAVTAGKAFIINATSATTLTLDGEGWSDGATAAPAVTATVNPTFSSVFVVEGNIAREDSLAAINGLQVSMTNLRSGATLEDVAGQAGSNGRFAATFVNLMGDEEQNFRIGDMVELRVTDPTGQFGGTQTVRKELNAREIRNGLISLDRILLSVVPVETVAMQNYPNPFNPETWIPFQLAESASVKITVFNASGELVRVLNIGHLPAGSYQSRSKAAYWDGTNQAGERVASGTYFYRIEAGSFSAMRRMVILK